MALNFPSNPVNDQSYVYNNTSYIFNSTLNAWKKTNIYGLTSIPQSGVINLISDLSNKAPLASPTFTGTSTFPTLLLTTADSTSTASHYIFETASDGIIRPKTLANVRAEIVTTAAVNSASVTVLGTVTSGVWQGSSISATYIDLAIARLASPTFTGIPTSTTAAVDTNTTQIATTSFVLAQASSSNPVMNGTVAIGTSTRYARADHVHASDTSRAPIASPTFTGIVTLAQNPTQALHAVTKQYVDALAEGLHVHASCQTATTASVNLSSPPASIDGVTLTNNMRVLVKNQSTTSQNGIYVFNGTSLVRASDFDTAAEINGGDFVFVTGGSINDNTGWVQTGIVVTVETDPITFTQFSGAGTYTAGNGLALNGNQFSNTGVLSVNGSTGAITNIATTTGKLSQFSTTTSAELAGVISDETGSGSLVFANSPILTTPNIGAANGTSLYLSSTLDATTPNIGTTGGIRVRGYTGGVAYIQFTNDVANSQWGFFTVNSSGNLSWSGNYLSPTLTGTPTAPTASAGTNTTQIATTAFVTTAVASGGGGFEGSLLLGGM